MTTTQDRSKLIAVLESSLYPGAQSQSIEMVIGYCEAAGLDPMLKPVHIVPMWDSKAGRMRDVVMPGVGLYRTQASRTGQFAGMSEPEFGADITATIGGQPVTYPEWCRVTVRRALPSGILAEFTAREYWTENYAVKGGKEKSIAPNAMWTKRPRGQIAKCFDEETEVLTTEGFQRFAEVTGRVMQVGDLGLEPTESKPFAQDWSGEMIVADGTRLNFSVTPNHDMLTTAGKIEAGELYELATQVGGKFSIPRAPTNGRAECDVSDGILQLLGFFLADGSHTGYRQFRIKVSREYKIEAMREIALHQRESIKIDAGRISQINGRDSVTNFDQTIFTYDFALIENFTDQRKQINVDAILRLSQRQARVVVDALLEFDGADNGGGTRRLIQKNAAVLRGFEVTAVHAGYSISALKRRGGDPGAAADVTVSEAVASPVVRGVVGNKASLVKRRNVSGKVWCVTVPSGIIVVRRRGFSMLCGNCASAQALRIAFPELGAAPTADEMEGKTLQPDDMIPGVVVERPVFDAPAWIARVNAAQTVDAVKAEWALAAKEANTCADKAGHAAVKAAVVARCAELVRQADEARTVEVTPTIPGNDDFVAAMEAEEARQ